MTAPIMGSFCKKAVLASNSHVGNFKKYNLIIYFMFNGRLLSTVH